MRHDASAPDTVTGSSVPTLETERNNAAGQHAKRVGTERSSSDIGALVVVAGEPGVWRIERFVGELRRCFSYVDGRVVVVAVDQLSPCPPGTRADQ